MKKVVMTNNAFGQLYITLEEGNYLSLDYPTLCLYRIDKGDMVEIRNSKFHEQRSATGRLLDVVVVTQIVWQRTDGVRKYFWLPEKNITRRDGSKVSFEEDDSALYLSVEGKDDHRLIVYGTFADFEEAGRCASRVGKYNKRWRVFGTKKSGNWAEIKQKDRNIP